MPARFIASGDSVTTTSGERQMWCARASCRQRRSMAASLDATPLPDRRCPAALTRAGGPLHQEIRGAGANGQQCDRRRGDGRPTERDSGIPRSSDVSQCPPQGGACFVGFSKRIAVPAFEIQIAALLGQDVEDGGPPELVRLAHHVQILPGQIAAPPR